MSPSVVRVVTWSTPARQTRSGELGDQVLWRGPSARAGRTRPTNFLPPTVGGDGFSRGGGAPCRGTARAGPARRRRVRHGSFIHRASLRVWKFPLAPYGRSARQRLLQQLVDELRVRLAPRLLDYLSHEPAERAVLPPRYAPPVPGWRPARPRRRRPGPPRPRPGPGLRARRSRPAPSPVVHILSNTSLAVLPRDGAGVDPRGGSAPPGAPAATGPWPRGGRRPSACAAPPS